MGSNSVCCNTHAWRTHVYKFYNSTGRRRKTEVRRILENERGGERQRERERETSENI